MLEQESIYNENLKKISKESPTSMTMSIFSLERSRQIMILKWHRYKERIHMDTLRPLPLFLGINQSFCFAPDAFSPPIKHSHLRNLSPKTTYEKVSQRVKLNVQFFLTNYFLIFMGIGTVVLCLNFKCLFYSGIVYGLWVAHDALRAKEMSYTKEDHQMRIQFTFQNHDYDISKYIPQCETRTKILYALTGWVFLFECLRPLVTIVGLTMFMVLFHAIMRDPKHVESTSVKSIMGDRHHDMIQQGYYDHDDYGSKDIDDVENEAIHGMGVGEPKSSGAIV